jgi:Cytochrome c3/Cytochrome c554 and c-prime
MMPRSWTVLVAVLLLVPGVDGVAAQERLPAIDSSYSCVVCHIDHRRAFLAGVHAERGIRCADCHGGNPEAVSVSAAHAGRFLGRPSKQQIVTLCATCHADPNRMRQFGLRSDEMAALRTSRHGQLLARGDDNAPTCTDCHEAHLIRRATDARSNTNPLNIPELCARCHADAARMAPYGIPANQFAMFSASAHGKALFQTRNFAAPTCVSCHGSHSALPPGVTEVADVCGRCHALVREAFSRGPHASATAQGVMSGCTACHSNHGTEHVAPDAVAEACAACHAAGTPASAVADSVEARVLEATELMDAAVGAMERLEAAGRPVADAELRYRTALTAYRQMAQIQHSLDLEALEALTLQVLSSARNIEETSEVAAEQRWEHQLLLIPVWFLALAVLVLARYRMAETDESGSSSGGRA